MDQIGEKPSRDQVDNLFYSHLHCSKSLQLIEDYSHYTNGSGFEGNLLRFYGKRRKKWLHCEMDAKNNEEFAMLSMVRDGDSCETLFRVFPTDKGDTVDLFACAAGAYVYPDNENASNSKHYVNAYFKSWTERGSGWVSQKIREESEDGPYTLFLVWATSGSGMYMSEKHKTRDNHFRVRVVPKSAMHRWEKFEVRGQVQSRL